MINSCGQLISFTPPLRFQYENYLQGEIYGGNLRWEFTVAVYGGKLTVGIYGGNFTVGIYGGNLRWPFTVG